MNISLPFIYQFGVITDSTGQTILKANREAGTTPLPPYQRDAMLQLVVELLNESFENGKAQEILTKLGYN